MKFCNQLEEVIRLLNNEWVKSNAQGYTTVTLTAGEVEKIARTLLLVRHVARSGTDSYPKEA